MLATAAAALGGSDNRAITRWLDPASGLFGDPRRWDNGVPGAGSHAIFGGTPGSNEFVVTAPGGITVSDLSVISQRPVLMLDIGLFRVLHDLTVAGTAPDVATLVLAEPPNGPFVSSTFVVDEVVVIGAPGASGEVHIEGARLYCETIAVGVGAGSVGLLRLSDYGSSSAAHADLGTNGGNGRIEAIGPQVWLWPNSLSLGENHEQPEAGVGTLAVLAGAKAWLSQLSFGPPAVRSSGIVRSRIEVRDPGSLVNVDSDLGSADGTISLCVGNGGIFQSDVLSLDDDSEIEIEIGPSGSGRIGNFTPTKLDGSFVARLPDDAQVPEGAIYEVISGTWASGFPDPPNDWFDSVVTPEVDGQPMVLFMTGNLVLLVDLVPSSLLTVTPSRCQVPEGFSLSVSPTLEFVPGFLIPIDRGVIWTSDDPSIAIGTASNIVVGVSPGTTTLRASLGSATAEVVVDVTSTKPSSTLVRASVSSDGIEGDKSSSSANGASFPAVSDHGRFVAFSSHATNLVPDDTNGVADIFVHDTDTGDTTRVSVTSSGGQSDAASLYPAISGDGRFVTFTSTSALLAGNGSTFARAYVHDRVTGVTSAVATKPNGELSCCGASYSDITPDGRYVAWIGDNGDVLDPPAPGPQATRAFRKDLWSGEIVLVSKTFTGGMSTAVDSFISISDDGTWIAFSSTGKIVAGVPSESVAQVFARAPDTGEAFAASRSPNGAWANATCVTARIDGAGRRVGFLSAATNLLPTSAGAQDFFVADRVDHSLRVANTAPDGSEANSAIGSIALSSSGRFATFRSAASNLVPGIGGTEQCFRKDLLTNAVELVSEGPVGPANGSCAFGSAVSPDGGVVVFGSEANNLVPLDLNLSADIFHRRLSPGVLGDLNGDDTVDGVDLGILLDAWSTTAFDPDLNRDGVVGPEDLGILLGAWAQRLGDT